MVRKSVAGAAKNGVLAFKHRLEEGAAFGDILVDHKLLVIGGDKEDHCCLNG